MNDKREYHLPFDEVDIIKQSSSPKINGKNIIITIDFNNFSNIEITKKTTGFFKKETTFTMTINENYLNNNLEVQEVNTILEFENEEIMIGFINKISLYLEKDVLLIKNKTMKNKEVFKEILLFLEVVENTIHRLPYNFNFNEQYIEYKIENFENFEKLILDIREHLPEFKNLRVDDFNLIKHNGTDLLKISLDSDLKFRVPFN